jgi:hypothetical protein
MTLFQFFLSYFVSPVKEKSQNLVQVEKLTRVKDEMTPEVDKLDAELQQEHSKVSALSAKVKKSVVGKKSIRSF